VSLNSLTSHEDNRIKPFSSKVELLKKINPEYAETVTKEFEYILGQDRNAKNYRNQVLHPTKVITNSGFRNIIEASSLAQSSAPFNR
jgi:flagellar motor switch protein FliG